MRRIGERIMRNEGPVRSRRGATLVLVAIMLSVIMGLAAMTVDFSRMYEFKAELKTLADGAAMSAILDQRNGLTEAQAEANAFLLRSANTVDGGQTATMTASDISPVLWNFTNKSSTSATWATANAVQVVVSYSANWTLARVFGTNTKTLRDTSIAAFGAVTTSNCATATGFPYAVLLKAVGRTSPYDVNSSLTVAEITTLKNNTSAQARYLTESNSLPAATTDNQFGWYNLEPGNGGNKFDQVIAEYGSCNSPNFGVGTTPSFTGSSFLKNGKLDATLTALSVSTADPVIVGFYGSTNAIKYLGVFKFTGYDNNGISGYFTSVSEIPSGTVSSAPGPITASMLVK